MKNQASGSDGKVKPAASEVLTAEVVVLQEKDNEQVWELFQTEAVEKNVSWKKETANDVGNSGFADTHSTGNRQRQHAHEMTVESLSLGQPVKSPTSASPHFAADLTRKPHELGESEVFEVFSGQDELSGDTCDSPMRLDALAGLCAVPDTACPRTLIRGYTSRELEKHLLSKGFKTITRSDNCTWVWQCGNPSLKRSSFDHCSHRS